MQSAELLGLLHSYLNDYELKKAMDTDWHNKFNALQNAKYFEELLDKIDNCPPQNLVQIREDLKYRMNLQSKIQKYGGYLDCITYTSTHGDYHSLQLICNENIISAVIDFSSACCIPVSWELMRSYVQSASECINADYININKLTAYIKKYMIYSKLTYNDLKYMPFIYLYQLGRSKYGYNEYILLDTENKEELLNFGSWRTNMCRYLENNSDILSKELCSIV